MAKGIILLLMWSAAWGVARAAEPTASTALAISLVLPAHHLPPLAERVMKEESVRIWEREGVQITWRDSEVDVPRGSRFILLTLIGDEERPHRTQQRYVLGDFLPDEGRIRISLFAASQAATNSAAASGRPRQAYEQPLALGYVLGRAVAHEVGHALLGRAHADAGLMEAVFKPGTMADSLSERFRLTHAESARLARARLDARADGEALATSSRP